jgi:hypothetical protein
MLCVMTYYVALSRGTARRTLLQGYAIWAAALTDGLSLHIEAATGVLILLL